MTSEREEYIQAMMLIADDFSDGAFMGFMEEKGISVEELVEVSEKNQANEERAE